MNYGMFTLLNEAQFDKFVSFFTESYNKINFTLILHLNNDLSLLKVLHFLLVKLIHCVGIKIINNCIIFNIQTSMPQFLHVFPIIVEKNDGKYDELATIKVPVTMFCLCKYCSLRVVQLLHL